VRIGPTGAQTGAGRKPRLQGFSAVFGVSYSQTTAGRLQTTVGCARRGVCVPSWPSVRPRMTLASFRRRVWLVRRRVSLLPQIPDKSLKKE
jgi:hypothetical protein